MPYGSSAWGTTPFGSIVPLAISSARATSTHTVLVTLTALPLAESSITTGDAMNPNTWECYTDTVTFTILSVRKVSNTEYELRTLQAFGAMTVSHTVRSYGMRNPYGVFITSPYTATFRGVVMAAGSRHDRLPFDLFSDPIGVDGFGGTLRVGPTGSYDRVYGTEMLKKQIIRRLITMPASFFHIEAGAFGVDLKMKQKISPSFLPELQTNITRDILREPNIKSAKVSLTLKNDGVLIIKIAAVSDFGTTDVSITAGS
mgnify:FL=1